VGTAPGVSPWRSGRGVSQKRALLPGEFADGARVLDFECFHSLSDVQREATGREVSAVATDDTTLLMLTSAPGRSEPPLCGANREDIQAAFPGWRVINEEAYEKSALPRALRSVDPRFYRLGRN
jgi:hypothetical protein